MKNFVILGAVLFGLGLFIMPRKVWATPTTANPYLADIMAAERNNDLPPQLLARVLYQESRYRPEIINGKLMSSAGAVGIAQIVPRWHPNVDATNPQESIYYAAGYLRRLFDRFGSWKRALAAYNWGQGNVSNAITRNGDKWLQVAPTETQNYVREILADVEANA